MADSNLSRHLTGRHLTGTFAVCALLLTALPAAQGAAPRVRQQPIVLDAQSMDATGDNVVFHRVKITQGEMSISAELGHGTGTPKKGAGNDQQVDFDDSVWVFRGNVKITVQDGVVNADEAAITFLKQVLTRAVANGNPATFEGRVAKAGKVAHGRAATIDYDASNELITLLTNAWITDGQREIDGPSLKYNMLSQSIQGDSSDSGSGQGSGSQRVHIVVPPPPSKQ